jgi:hypothetical protein
VRKVKATKAEGEGQNISLQSKRRGGERDENESGGRMRVRRKGERQGDRERPRGREGGRERKHKQSRQYVNTDLSVKGRTTHRGCRGASTKVGGHRRGETVGRQRRQSSGGKRKMKKDVEGEREMEGKNISQLIMSRNMKRTHLIDAQRPKREGRIGAGDETATE